MTPLKFSSVEDAASPGSCREAYAAAREELARVRAERTELAFRCERLEAALAAASDGVWDFDIPRGRVFYSPGWARMLGFEPCEVGDSVADAIQRVHPDDRPRLESMIERHLAGSVDGAYRIEFRLQHREGHWVSVLSRGEVVRDHLGQPVRFIGTHVDLSTLERARIAAA